MSTDAEHTNGTHHAAEGGAKEVNLSVPAISEDTLTYLRDKHVPELLEYLLRCILRDRPERPVKYLNALTKNALPPRIMIAGPPACGKGTQCQQICAYYKRKTGRKPVHISSGDLLRDQVHKRTSLGLIAEGYMKEGHLVPDSLMIGMIRERMHEEDVLMNGWLLDGFPRNQEQAAALDAEGFSPDLFLILDTPDEVLIERVEGRRLDPATGKIYHMKYNPPPEDDYALLDRLEHRDDDSREVLQPRLEEFHHYVNGLLTHYAAVAESVDANRPEAAITEDIIACIDRHRLI